jgi:hypothetical protein
VAGITGRIDPEQKRRLERSIQLCQEQLTYELNGIRVYVRPFGELADQTKSLVLEVNEPPAGMEACIFSELHIGFSKLCTCCRTCVLVQS